MTNGCGRRELLRRALGGGVFTPALFYGSRPSWAATPGQAPSPAPGPAPGVTYHVDSANGDDRNSGTATDRPWKTLEKVNSFVFSPGDRILFQTGSRFVGRLKPQGSGKQGAPIIENGQRVWKTIDDLDWNADCFEELGAAFERVQPVKIGRVGSAAARLFSQRAAVDFAAEWITERRRIAY